MKFDKIVSQVLNEDVSKDNRINALKKLNELIHFKVIDTCTSRGVTDIYSTEIVTGRWPSVAEQVKDRFITHIVDDFDSEEELEKYVDEWFTGPLRSYEGEEYVILTGEETAILIFSQNSKYFDYTDEQILANFDEIDSLFDWNQL